jgi:hypothetical protein
MTANELLAQDPLRNIPTALRRKYFQRALSSLANNRVFNVVTITNNREVRIEIHDDFIDDALALYRSAPPFPVESSNPLIDIPASDRFVPVNHNSPDLQEALSKLEDIENRVSKSNELTANREERLAIIREVSDIRKSLKEPLVRLASIWAATTSSGILLWLAKHGGDAALNALATEAIDLLVKIFGFYS